MNTERIGSMNGLSDSGYEAVTSFEGTGNTALSANDTSQQLGMPIFSIAAGMTFNLEDPLKFDFSTLSFARSGGQTLAPEKGEPPNASDFSGKTGAPEPAAPQTGPFPYTGTTPSENCWPAPPNAFDTAPFDSTGAAPPGAPGVAPPCAPGAAPPCAPGAAPPSDSGAAPPGDSGAAPPGDSGAAPPGDSGAAPPGDSGAAPSGDSDAAPSGDSDAAPPSDSDAAPSGDSDAAPPSDSDAAPPGDSDAAPSGDSDAAPPGDSDAAPSDDTTTEPASDRDNGATDGEVTKEELLADCHLLPEAGKKGLKVTGMELALDSNGKLSEGSKKEVNELIGYLSDELGDIEVVADVYENDNGNLKANLTSGGKTNVTYYPMENTIYIVHTHPGGSTTPSQTDLDYEITGAEDAIVPSDGIAGNEDGFDYYLYA